MPYHLEDTIAAIASASGGAYRGIIRISGPQVTNCLSKCFCAIGDDGQNWFSLRRATVLSGNLTLAQPIGNLPCDVYYWPTPCSYTGQPSAEIHTIGSPPLLQAALEAVCSTRARLAEPGEFTMRAFLAGRLDLTQAEAVLGVIDAGNRAELDVALTQLAGGLSSPLNQLRDRLLDLLAHLEAGLDFVEEDIEFISAEELTRHLKQAANDVDRIARQISERVTVTDDVRVVLVGWPNTGKSSLLNALGGDRAAIVSDVAGTTRDYVTKRVDFNGIGGLLIDTAGVEFPAHDHALAAAAQTVTAAQHEQAHFQLLCIDSTRPMNAWERTQLTSAQDVPRLIVLTKIDAPRQTDYDGRAIETSSQTGAGLAELRQAIAESIAASAYHESGVVGCTAIRCRESLRLAAHCLARAQQLASASMGEELVAAEIRNALEELGKVVGAVYTDDVLDRIFSRFCIGK